MKKCIHGITKYIYNVITTFNDFLDELNIDNWYPLTCKFEMK